jgi:hypothetical protein
LNQEESSALDNWAVSSPAPAEKKEAALASALPPKPEEKKAVPSPEKPPAAGKPQPALEIPYLGLEEPFPLKIPELHLQPPKTPATEKKIPKMEPPKKKISEPTIMLDLDEDDSEEKK